MRNSFLEQRPTVTTDKPEPLGMMACKVAMRARVSSAAKAVAAILVDHVNWTDFRCDPGIERLVMLSGYSRSNVQAGLQQLEDDTIIVIHIHGGRLGRNSYEFRWDVIRARDAEAQEARKVGRPPTRIQGLPRPDSGAQTRVLNPKEEPVGWPEREKTQTVVMDRRAARPITQARREVAETDAIRRWSRALHERFGHNPDIYGPVIRVIDADIHAEATKAEMHQRWSGIHVILRHLRQRLPKLRLNELQKDFRHADDATDLQTEGSTEPQGPAEEL